MKSFLGQMFSKSNRRSVRPSAFGTSFDCYEERTLLSGVAIYPQPAAAVAPAADPPGNFAGTWTISSDQGGGTAQITQEGSQAQVALNILGFDFDGTAKVKGNVASFKIKETILGAPIRGKVTATLTGADTFTGTAAVKKSPLGKMTINFDGARDV